MKFPLLGIKPLLLVTALTLPGVALAQTFPCDSGSSCNSQASSKAQAHNEKQGSILGLGKNDATPSFMMGIELTEEQRSAISQVVQNQLPTIREKVQSLENAHAMLREMAVSRRYDEATAVTLSQMIADSSAALALLQAEREYQVYALLTPEQTRRFDQLKEQENRRVTQ